MRNKFIHIFIIITNLLNFLVTGYFVISAKCAPGLREEFSYLAIFSFMIGLFTYFILASLGEVLERLNRK